MSASAGNDERVTQEHLRLVLPVILWIILSDRQCSLVTEAASAEVRLCAVLLGGVEEW